MNEKDTINHYKKYGVEKGDKMLLKVAKGNYKAGYDNAKKEILEKIDKIKIRNCCSYPTMLKHHYISQRDFEELKQQLSEVKK